MAMIPVLIDEGFIVSESHAIMLYLLEKYGADHKERLYPSDLKTRTKVNQCLYFDASMFFIRLKLVALPALFDANKGPTQRQLDDIDAAFTVVEAYLQNTKYIAADHLTLADLSVGSTATAIQAIHKLDAEKFPKVQQWLDRLNEETYFKNINEPGAALFDKTLKLLWEKNRVV